MCITTSSIISGKVSTFDDKFVLSSQSGSSTLEVDPKAEGLVFGYAEASEVLGLASNASGLIVSSPSGDRLVFMELPSLRQ